MSTDLPTRRGKLLIELRKRTSCPKRNDFCNKYGIPYGSLRTWESGNHAEIGSKGITKLVEAFQQEGINCTAENILNGDLNVSDVILTNANTVLDLSLIQNEESRSLCKSLLKSYQNIEIACLTDNSLYPSFNKDDLVIGLKKINVNILNKNYSQKLSIVKASNNRVFINFIEKSNTTDLYNIRAIDSSSRVINLKTEEIREIYPVSFIIKSN